MNLLEAIQGAGENWFRPICMTKGCAYGLGDFGLLVKHSLNGGTFDQICVPIIHLTGEWEIVTPEQVLSERKL